MCGTPTQPLFCYGSAKLHAGVNIAHSKLAYLVGKSAAILKPLTDAVGRLDLTRQLSLQATF